MSIEINYQEQGILIAGIKGVALLQVREKLGWSQEEVAERMGGREEGWYQQRVARLEEIELITDSEIVKALVDVFVVNSD